MQPDCLEINRPRYRKYYNSRIEHTTIGELIPPFVRHWYSWRVSI